MIFLAAPNLSGGQAKVLGQLDIWIEPELCFTTFAIHMNVHSRFLA